MKNQIKINNYIIGENHPTFIIAEAGVNHNGNITLAKKLVDKAAEARADAVKFQTFKAEQMVTPQADAADYAKKNLNSDINQLDMIKKYELEYDDFKNLKKYCDDRNIIFLSTPHSFDAIDFLEPLIPAYKFGSGDITNIPSLVYAAEKNKPLILGTGMSTLEEVKTAVDAIKKTGNEGVILLHCTTNYPCPIDEVNLNAMQTIKNETDCIVGYSDHTLDLMIPSLAVALGAKVIEKHFTVDKNLPGPDHKASLEPDEFKEMIQNIRNTEKILGSYEKKPTDSEEKIKEKVRKSIVATEDISKGAVISRSMITFKRPATGLNPDKIELVIGKNAKSDIKENDVIALDMVE